MKIFAFVPAKPTSNRTENKNKFHLNGERLYIRALKTLLQCKNIDKVFLDTDSEMEVKRKIENNSHYIESERIESIDINDPKELNWLVT